MEDIIGGELLFKWARQQSSSCAGFPMSSCKHNAFITDFLKVEVERDIVRKQYEEKLDSIRKSRKLQRNVYSRQMKFEKDTSQATLMTRYHELMSSLAQFNQLVVKGSHEMAEDIDVELMKEVVTYFSLIKQESSWAKGRRDNSHSSFHREACQAKVKKDLLLFSTHLLEESRGSIKLTYMEKDSAQFKRCEKAVLDNVGRGFEGSIQVLSVLKLDHLFLSSALHKAVNKNTGGKIKGLFAFVSKQNIYSMCTFGLHAQVLPDSRNSDVNDRTKSNLKLSVNKVLVSTNSKGKRKHGAPEIFRPSWFAIEPIIRAQTNGTHATLKPNQPRSYGIARSIAESRRIYNMRFSKKSVSPSFCCREDEEDTGAFLALCRVYVAKLLTIDEKFTTRIIEGALEGNYDAVFSTVTGEYCLLNPYHVLPEFIIQCVTTTSVNIADKAKEGTLSRSSKSSPRTMFLHSKELSHLSCRSLAQYISCMESNLKSETSSNGKTEDGNNGDDEIFETSEVSSRIRGEQKVEIASIIAEAKNEFFEKKSKLVKDLINEQFAKLRRVNHMPIVHNA